MKYFVKHIFTAALDGIYVNFFRSFLTTLGIIFGVASVVSMLSISAGAQEKIIQQLEKLGFENIIIQYDYQINFQNSRENEKNTQTNTFSGLTTVDLENFKELFGAENVASLSYFREDCLINNQRQKLAISCPNLNFATIFNFKITKGRYFNQTDFANNSKVCLITSIFARKYFTAENPIGKEIKIGKNWYTIIGVLKDQNINQDLVSDLNLKGYNYNLLIPFSTYHNQREGALAKAYYHSLIIRQKEVEKLSSALGLIKKTLLRLHQSLKEYQLIIPANLLAQKEETQHIFNIVMGTIASISLLVGGIGIMNIMLANCLERKQEIGIKRALGATKKIIVAQFLTEASILSLTGGFLGISLGYLMTYAISSYAEWETAISFNSILISFLVSISIGIIFGFYPALNAAGMDPIESLRSE